MDDIIERINNRQTFEERMDDMKLAQVPFYHIWNTFSNSNVRLSGWYGR